MANSGASESSRDLERQPFLSGDSRPASRSLDGKPLLGLHLTITSIHNIDTTKGLVTICFDADFFIKVQKGSTIQMGTGHIPKTHEEAIKELKAIFAETFVIGQIDLISSEKMTTDDWGDGLLEGVVGGEVKFKVTQKMSLDLEDFPFDVQHVLLRFYQNYDRAYIIVSSHKFWEQNCDSPYASPMITIPSALISEEWELHSPMIHFEETDPRETNGAYSLVTVTLNIYRKGAGYGVRIMSIMAMLSLCSLLPLMVKPEMSAGGMLSFEVGLLFATVTFQLLISSFLPLTSVATILDRYGRFLFFYIFLIMVVIALGSFVSYQTKKDKLDSAVHAAWLLGGWFLYHVHFACTMWTAFNRRNARLESRSSLSMPSFKSVPDESSPLQFTTACVP